MVAHLDSFSDSVNILMVSYFSITPFTFDSDFTSSIITLVSLLQFYLCWQITWETKRQHNCKHCCLCVNWVADGWCPVTNRHDCSLAMMHICNYMVMVYWRARSEVWTLCNDSYCTIVTKIWTVLLGDWYYLTNSWWLKFMPIRAVQSQ